METLIDHINKDNKKHEMPLPISASGARSAGGVQKNEIGFVFWTAGNVGLETLFFGLRSSGLGLTS